MGPQGERAPHDEPAPGGRRDGATVGGVEVALEVGEVAYGEHLVELDEAGFRGERRKRGPRQGGIIVPAAEDLTLEVPERKLERGAKRRDGAEPQSPGRRSVRLVGELEDHAPGDQSSSGAAARG